MLAPWSEHGVTWQSLAEAFEPQAVTTSSNQAAPLSFSLTPLVEAWVRGAVPNHGVLLRDAGPHFTNFWSSEQATASLRPELHVCYTHTPLPPGCQSGLPCATGSPGVCAAGSTMCVNGKLTCAPHAPPSVEMCDGLDNDCNGLADAACARPTPP